MFVRWENRISTLVLVGRKVNVQHMINAILKNGKIFDPLAIFTVGIWLYLRTKIFAFFSNPYLKFLIITLYILIIKGI